MWNPGTEQTRNLFDSMVRFCPRKGCDLPAVDGSEFCVRHQPLIEKHALTGEEDFHRRFPNWDRDMEVLELLSWSNAVTWSMPEFPAFTVRAPAVKPLATTVGAAPVLVRSASKVAE